MSTSGGRVSHYSRKVFKCSQYSLHLEGEAGLKKRGKPLAVGSVRRRSINSSYESEEGGQRSRLSEVSVRDVRENTGHSENENGSRKTRETERRKDGLACAGSGRSWKPARPSQQV